MNDFREQLKIIEEQNIIFINPLNFEKSLKSKKSKRKILLDVSATN